MNCTCDDGGNCGSSMPYGGVGINCLLPSLYNQVKKRREKSLKMSQISREK